MWERLSLPISHIRRERPSTPSAHMAPPVPLSPRTGLFFLDVQSLQALREISFRLRDRGSLIATAPPARRKRAMLVRSLTPKPLKSPHDYGVWRRKHGRCWTSQNFSTKYSRRV